VPVENQLIVSADGVAIKDRPLVGARQCRHHFVTNGWFVEREGRSAQVYDDLRALLDQTPRRLAIVKRAGEIMFRPDVFADRDADFFSIQIERLDLFRRLKITVLVEHIVSWEKRFMRFANRLTADEQGSGVVKRPGAAFVSIDKADEQRGFPDAPMKFVQNLERFRDKTRFENKVLRRIAGDRELGCDDQVRAGCGQALVELENLLKIAAQIPNCGIELGEPDFHPAKLSAGEPAAMAFCSATWTNPSPSGAYSPYSGRRPRLRQKPWPIRLGKRQERRRKHRSGLSERRWRAPHSW